MFPRNLLHFRKLLWRENVRTHLPVRAGPSAPDFEKSPLLSIKDARGEQVRDLARLIVANLEAEQDFTNWQCPTEERFIKAQPEGEAQWAPGVIAMTKDRSSYEPNPLPDRR